jgi:hypothetical protein
MLANNMPQLQLDQLVFQPWDQCHPWESQVHMDNLNKQQRRRLQMLPYRNFEWSMT